MEPRGIVIDSEKEPLFLVINKPEFREPNDIISINKCLKVTRENIQRELTKDVFVGDPKCPDYGKQKPMTKTYILFEVSI
jgi:hypothetical protein